MFSLGPTTKLHLRVRCDALVRRTRASTCIVARSPFVADFFFTGALCKKQPVKSGFITRVVDLIIMPV